MALTVEQKAQIVKANVVACCLTCAVLSLILTVH